MSAHGGGVEEGRADFRVALKSLGEAAVAADRGGEALDDPAPGLDGEADLVGFLRTISTVMAVAPATSAARRGR